MPRSKLSIDNFKSGKSEHIGRRKVKQSVTSESQWLCNKVGKEGVAEGRPWPRTTGTPYPWLWRAFVCMLCGLCTTLPPHFLHLPLPLDRRRWRAHPGQTVAGHNRVMPRIIPGAQPCYCGWAEDGEGSKSQFVVCSVVPSMNAGGLLLHSILMSYLVDSVGGSLFQGVVLTASCGIGMLESMPLKLSFLLPCLFNSVSELFSSGEICGEQAVFCSYHSSYLGFRDSCKQLQPSSLPGTGARVVSGQATRTRRFFESNCTIGFLFRLCQGPHIALLPPFLKALLRTLLSYQASVCI